MYNTHLKIFGIWAFHISMKCTWIISPHNPPNNCPGLSPICPHSNSYPFVLLITCWVQCMTQNFVCMCDMDADYCVVIHTHTSLFGVMYCVYITYEIYTCHGVCRHMCAEYMVWCTCICSVCNFLLWWCMCVSDIICMLGMVYVCL